MDEWSRIVNKPLPKEEPHFHKDEHGILVRCYHKCSRTPWISFLIGITVSFPLEHLLWEKVWPFSLITHWMGL